MVVPFEEFSIELHRFFSGQYCSEFVIDRFCFLFTCKCQKFEGKINNINKNLRRRLLVVPIARSPENLENLPLQDQKQIDRLIVPHSEQVKQAKILTKKDRSRSLEAS